MAVDEAHVTGVGQRFLDALDRRDYDPIAACFAEQAQLRAVVPRGVREDDRPDAIAARFQLRTGPTGELVDSAADMVGDVLRLRYVIRGVDPELGLCVFEQTAYAEVVDGEITRMRVACSGDRPVVRPGPSLG